MLNMHIGNEITKVQTDIINETVECFPDKTEFSIALIENNKVNFFGVKKLKGSIVNINNQISFFKIGSITKLFTSTILSNLVIKNGIKLNDTIDSFLPFSINNNEKITLLSLANHTSGISNYPFDIDFDENTLENPLAHFNENQLVTYLQKELTIEPSKKNSVSYSNLGFVILGYILENIENKKYHELIDQYVFSKYNMHTSSLRKDKIKGKLVPGLDKNGKEIALWENITFDPAGETTFSSVLELSKFVINQFDGSNKILNLTKKATFSRDEKIDVGLGWAIHKNEDNTKYHFHPGGLRGFRSCLVINEINKTGVIVLSNVSCFHEKSITVNQLCFDLIATLNKNEPLTLG